MNRTQTQKYMLAALALCSALVSTALYCPPQKALTYEEALSVSTPIKAKATKAR